MQSSCTFLDQLHRLRFRSTRYHVQHKYIVLHFYMATKRAFIMQFKTFAYMQYVIHRMAFISYASPHYNCIFIDGQNNKSKKNCSIFCCCSSFVVVLLLLLPFRRIPTSMEMGIVKNVNDHNRITSIYIFAPRIACHAWYKYSWDFSVFNCSCRNKNVFLVIITNIFA